MKSIYKQSLKAVVWVVVSSVMAGSLPAAEPKEGEPRGDQRRGEQRRGEQRPGDVGGQRPEGFRGRPQGGPGGGFQNLSEEAREAMREVFSAMRENGGNSMRKMGEVQRELSELITSGKVDEKAIRAKVLAKAELEAEVTISRARAFAKLKEKGVSDEVLKQISGVLSGGFRGGPGGPGAREGGGNRPGDGDGFRGRGQEGEREKSRSRTPAKDGAGKEKPRRPEFDK